MNHTNLNFVHLFVSDPQKSAQFYEKLLGTKPAIESPTYVLFRLPNLTLGLWERTSAEPAVTAEPGSSELVITEKDVDAVYTTWVEKGISIAQEPTTAPFGRTFVALDPDGHRLRVYWPAE